MKIIRGATTIERDEKEEIKQAVSELLTEIVQKNALSLSEIEGIIFSGTSDIHAYYPAKAAREVGFDGAALFSAVEPDIEGGLPLCIRTMIFVEKNITPKHVYLRGAKVLRKDLSSKINIALDGPAGSGKSTVAKALAKDYHILYLDTGAMYRACGLYALRNGVDLSDENSVCDMMNHVDLCIEYVDGKQVTLLGKEDVSEAIREPNVSMAASTVSKYPCVRVKLVEKQREIAQRMSCVLDGRDIGSYVLPNADFKFYLTASSAVRAKRRYDELTQRGFTVDYEALKAEIEARDLQDSTREFAPLKVADGAVVVDTSDLTVDEVIAQLKRQMQEKI